MILLLHSEASGENLKVSDKGNASFVSDDDKPLDSNDKSKLETETTPKSVTNPINKSDAAEALSPSLEPHSTDDSDYEPSTNQAISSIPGSVTVVPSVSISLEEVVEPALSVTEKPISDDSTKEVDKQGAKAVEKTDLEITTESTFNSDRDPAQAEIKATPELTEELAAKESTVPTGEKVLNNTLKSTEENTSEVTVDYNEQENSIPTEKAMDDIDRALNNEDVVYSSDEEGRISLPHASSVNDLSSKVNIEKKETDSLSDSSSDSSSSDSDSDSDSEDSEVESEAGSNGDDAEAEDELSQSKTNKRKNKREMLIEPILRMMKMTMILMSL